MIMKKINLRQFYRGLLIPLLFLACLSCKKMNGYNIPVSLDKTPPEMVSNVKVSNFSGGAYITYTLPKTENILYVIARYKINGSTFKETKSSYYSDTLKVEGFAESKDYDVTLYTVSRADIKSEPQVVTVHPGLPAYLRVKPTVTVSPDFGGVRIKGGNLDQKAVTIVLLAFDPKTNGMEVEDQTSVAKKDIDYTIRGYASVERKFGVYVTDRFGNRSDTTTVNITPYFETLLDKSKFSVYKLPSDGVIGDNWPASNLFNGNLGEPGWHTVVSPLGMPANVTFKMGQTAKLSRFILWNRGGEYAYSHGNPRVFSLWGTDKDNPGDAVLPLSSAVGTVIGDWRNLANYRFPDPPSGNVATAAIASDRSFVEAGVNFNVPIDAPKIKYFRLSVAQTWSGGGFAHVLELSFYGTPE